jgi:SAM-dependent methyltransferase
VTAAHMAFREVLYQRYASTFKNETAAASVEWWDHKYLPLLRGLDHTAPILELGCGSGKLLAYLQSRGFTGARGVDISAEQVELARQRGVNAEQGDLLDALDQQHGSLALIIAVDVLEHLTRDELLRLARGTHAALHPGGRLLIQTANGAGLFPGQVMYGDLTHVTILTPESLGQLVRAVGFVDRSVYETGPVPIRLRGKLNVLLWRLVKGLANAVRAIETGKRQSIWTENFICLARTLSR